MMAAVAQLSINCSNTLQDVRLSEWCGGAPCGAMGPQDSEGCGPSEVLCVFNSVTGSCHCTILR